MAFENLNTTHSSLSQLDHSFLLLLTRSFSLSLSPHRLPPSQHPNVIIFYILSHIPVSFMLLSIHMLYISFVKNTLSPWGKLSQHPFLNWNSFFLRVREKKMWFINFWLLNKQNIIFRYIDDDAMIEKSEFTF